MTNCLTTRVSIRKKTAIETETIQVTSLDALTFSIDEMQRTIESHGNGR